MQKPDKHNPRRDFRQSNSKTTLDCEHIFYKFTYIKRKKTRKISGEIRQLLKKNAIIYLLAMTVTTVLL